MDTAPSPLVANDAIAKEQPASSLPDIENVPSITEQLSTSIASIGSHLSASSASLGRGLSTKIASIEDGYVNAGGGNGEAGPSGDERKDVFNGMKGTVQLPKYKDLKYAFLFVLHFGITIWWLVDSFIPHYNAYNGQYYYKKINHVGLVAFVTVVGIVGLGMGFLIFSYMLRNGETALKTSLMFSTAACGGVGVLGLLFGEMFMCVCGLVGFAIVGTYANIVWSRIPFTATNLSVAIDAVRANMGLFLAALSIAAVAYVWLCIGVTAGVNGYRSYGHWTMVYTIFSYYWTHQVLTNVLGVTTAGVIGRWFVTGEETPKFTSGLKETLAIARTHSFGSICYGSLFSGIVQIFRGLSSFLSSKGVPGFPKLLDWFVGKVNNVIDDTNEMAYVYVGMYGYSYSAGAKNATALLQTKGWDGIAKYKLAGNILFIPNLTIGLLTGFCGLVFGTFEYGMMRRGGLYSPDADGFFIGFLVGFLFSSIILGVVTATVNTLIVCLAESPSEFKSKHPNLCKKMESVWPRQSTKGGHSMSLKF